MPERALDPYLIIGLWVVLAFVLSALPSNNSHWRRAYVLIAVGLPLLVWLTWQHGLWVGLVGLMAGCLVLRWPVYYGWKWLQRRLKGD